MEKYINIQPTRIPDDNISERNNTKHMLVVDYRMTLLLLLLFKYVPIHASIKIGSVVNRFMTIDNMSNIFLFLNAFFQRNS